MKISKELITGAIAILAIGLFVLGINFLKGNSFFGGDDLYYAYFANSGQLSPASSVTLNGVNVGKVLAVEYVPKNTPEKKVKVSFNITEDNIRIPLGSHVEIGSLDLFSKGMLIHLNSNLSKGYHKSESFDHSLLDEVPYELNKMIAGNIQIDDIPSLKNKSFIIDLSGALEDENGKKDIDKIDKLLNLFTKV